MQLSVKKPCDKPRSNFFVPVTTRAAAFNTRCNLSFVAFGAYTAQRQDSITVIDARRYERMDECGCRLAPSERRERRS